MIDSLLEKYFDYDHPIWHEFQHKKLNIDTLFVWSSGAGGHFILSEVDNPPTVGPTTHNEYTSRMDFNPEWGVEVGPENLIWLRLDWFLRQELSEEIFHTESKEYWTSYITDLPRIPIMLGERKAINRLYKATKQVLVKESQQWPHGDFRDYIYQWGATHDLPYILDNVCNLNINNMIHIVSPSDTAWMTWWLTFIKNEMTANAFQEGTKVHRLFDQTISKLYDPDKGKRSNYYLIDEFINAGWFMANRPMKAIEPNSILYFEMLVEAINHYDNLDTFDTREWLTNQTSLGWINPIDHDFNNDYTQYAQEYFNNTLKNFIIISYEDLFFKLDLSKLSFLNLDKNKIREYSLRNIKLLKQVCRALNSNESDKLLQLLDYEKFLSGRGWRYEYRHL